MSIQNKKVGDVMLGVGSFPVVTDSNLCVSSAQGEDLILYLYLLVTNAKKKKRGEQRLIADER